MIDVFIILIAQYMGFWFMFCFVVFFINKFYEQEGHYVPISTRRSPQLIRVFGLAYILVLCLLISIFFLTFKQMSYKTISQLNVIFSIQISTQFSVSGWFKLSSINSQAPFSYPIFHNATTKFFYILKAPFLFFPSLGIRNVSLIQDYSVESM